MLKSFHHDMCLCFGLAQFKAPAQHDRKALPVSAAVCGFTSWKVLDDW